MSQPLERLIHAHDPSAGYADGAVAMRDAILRRLRQMHEHWKYLEKDYAEKDKMDDHYFARDMRMHYEMSIGVAEGAALEIVQEKARQ